MALPTSSIERLRRCHPDLQRLFLALAEEEYFTISTGFRNKEEQDKAYRTGNSQVQWPKSKHNRYPAEAVDVVLYKNGEVTWDFKEYEHFSSVVQRKARALDIPVTWGGNWDGLRDGPHFELKTPTDTDEEPPLGALPDPYEDISDSPSRMREWHKNPPPAVKRYVSKEMLEGQGSLLGQLDVEDADETTPLVDLPVPEEGELDIGDLRFGSVLVRALDESHLNQPSGITQQNAGAVGILEMPRTDMSPVLGDNRVLPEVLLTITLNATTRDDVVRVLRPLVAMERNLPFLACRNADIARLMLGIGIASRGEEVIRRLLPPEATEEDAEELRRQFDETSPNEVWVPVTMGSLNIQSQSGAPDLYQVHVVLRYANVLPYVPRMSFWRRTEDAVTWARYLSHRSQQGIDVIDVQENGVAQIDTPFMDSLLAHPPEDMGFNGPGGQTMSPHESYVFKKFYRSLLQEFHPVYVRSWLREPDEAEHLIPIGYGAEREPIYEPAYPISDNERLMELYDPNAPIGLRYASISAQQTREARMQRLLRAFDRQRALADLMSNTASLLSAADFAEFRNLGKLSPFTFTMSYDLGVIMLGWEQTSQQFQRAARRVGESIRSSRRTDIDEAVTEFFIDEDGDLGEREIELDFPDDSIAAGILRDAQRMYEGGLVDFQVPDGQYREVFVPFTTELVKIQRAVLGVYASAVHRLEEDASEDWTNFIQRHREELGEDTDAALRSYMLTYDFISELLKEPWFNENYHGLHQKLTRIVEESAQLTASINEAISSERQYLSEHGLAGTRTLSGFMDLENATIEGLSLRFSQRFGDKAWDAYAHPVSQHIGGGNGEVTLRLTTDDLVLIEQLGELSQSQIALNELRKSADVAPPLVEVYGSGNLLRAFGIKRLAYRSHTITMVKSRPGFFHVEVDFIQDEETLSRREEVIDASVRGGRLFETAALAPLFTPKLNGEDLSIYAFAQTLYPDYVSEGREADALEVIKTLQPVSTEVAYRPAEQGRQASLEGRLFYYDEGRLLRRQDLDLAQLFPAVVSFLDFARTDLQEGHQRILVRLVEAALADYLGSLIDVAAGLASGLKAPVPSVGVIRDRFPETKTLPTPEQKEELTDNLTEAVAALLRGEEAESFLIGLAAGRLLQSVNEVSRLVASNVPVRNRYLEWAASWAVRTDSAIDITEINKALKTLSENYERAEKKLPSCYPDLLIRPLRDPLHGVHVMAYDFPFGPGTPFLIEDEFLRDYRFAEQMRLLTTLQMATIGLDVLEELEVEVPTGATEIVGYHNGNPGAGTQIEREVTETQRYLPERVTWNELDSALRRSLADIEDFARENDRAISFPFSSKDLNGALQHLDELGVLAGEMPFSGQRSRLLTKRDLVEIMRTSQAIKYASYIAQAARMSLDGKPVGDPQTVIDLLRDHDAGLFESGLSVEGLTRSAANVADLQDDLWLARERMQLINLYSEDPETIAGVLGWTDSSAEPARAELLDKLRQRWKGPIGMRRAFPSYQLLMVGPVGSAHYQLLADFYAWTAVQKIEIRAQADSAGQYCDLILSNMRNRLWSEMDRTRRLKLDRGDERRLEVRPGTYMHVYVGYGPDTAHLTSFAGRVTQVMPGPITQVRLSSYSTSLTNPPNDGKGFFINGWDGQATIAETVLYTISKTTGLEGLGRGSITGQLDALGRSERGVVGDEFRVSLASALYRAIGRPGLRTITGDAFGEASSVLDAIADMGLTELRESFVGDPRIFENVWLPTGRARYGWTNLFLGGFADYLTSGKGWGWAALPGETCWSQLKDQSLLFPDFVVTTRPYNAGLPLRDMADHPPRQTLYFGPKHGSYISTSHPVARGSTMAKLEEQDLNAILQRVYGDAGAGLRELYKEVFVDQFLVPILLNMLYDGGEAIIDEVLGSAANWLHTALQGGNFSGSLSSGETYSLLRGRNLTDDQEEVLQSQLAAVFPNTLETFNARLQSLITERSFFEDLLRGFSWWDGNFWLGNETLLEAWFRRSGLIEGEAQRILAIFDPDRAKQEHIDVLLEGFRDDLAALVMQQSVYKNLTGVDPAIPNPVQQSIRERLLDSGYIPDRRFQPVVEHHMTSMYKSVITNNLRASSDDPDFANKVSITFPKEPDERLSAYLGQHGSLWGYSIQANPLISPDFIQEKVVYYPNLRLNHFDEAGKLADQIRSRLGEDMSFADLVEQHADFVEAREDGKDTVEYNNARVPVGAALSDVERRLSRLMEEMSTSISLKPKFSTVATNILSQSLSLMYRGEVVMAGSPELQPYHMLHLWDDVKQMHGPVEIDGVYHTFGPEGFYTVVSPRLATIPRGMDPTFDTLWLNYSSFYHAATSWISRIGGGTMSALGIATRASMFAGLLSWRPIRGLLYKLGGRAALASIPAIGWGYTLLDISYTVLTSAYRVGREKVERYVGMMAEQMDANPIILLPLTYRGRAYVAGLTGATGPASLRAALLDSIEAQRYETLSPSTMQTIRQRLGSVGPQLNN